MLLKSLLGSLLTYYMSMYKIPMGVQAKLESLRNRFLDVDKDDMKISWFSWENALASNENEGLGVNSFFALNMILLFKYIWWFRSFPHALWVREVKVINGQHGFLDRDIPASKNYVWLDMVKSMSHF